jgi:hypothetical protein
MSVVQVRVVTGDALTTPADVLVLKYAQGLHGLDAMAAQRLGVDEALLPSIGKRVVLAGAGMVTPGQVMFLGVPRLHRFDYEEIRVFGRRAIVEAVREVPRAEEICLTVHGPNYGLDEVEAFNSELAGVIDAVTEDLTDGPLRVITFIERQGGRAQRMEEALAAAIPTGRLRTGVGPVEAGVRAEAVDRLSTVGFDSADKAHVFVAMPFSPAFEDVYTFGIVPAAHASNLLAERMDQSSFTGDIVTQMRARISGARLFVADVTGANPNVYLEIGFAWGNGIPTILICKDVDELMFDVRGHRCLSYTNIVELNRRLTVEIGNLVTS